MVAFRQALLLCLKNRQGDCVYQRSDFDARAGHLGFADFVRSFIHLII